MSKPTTQQNKLETLWFTRCAGGGRGGVPTASGIAYKLGYFDGEFGKEGIRLRTLQDADAVAFRNHHYDHGLESLIREGGNLFAIPAKAQGADTRLIGLTWIDEAQSVLVRPGSDVRSPKDLKGKRLALPAYRQEDLDARQRGRSIARHMSVQGYRGALASAGLTLDDVKLVEVGGRKEAEPGDTFGGFWPGYEPLVKGDVDAIYVKGAPGRDGARQYGVVVGIDLDKLPERRFRVNNGTPRPITVHQRFLDDHYDLLVRFLHQTLRAAEWSKSNLQGVREILQSETGSSAEAVEAAYRDGFHLSLAPDLSSERVDLFRQQTDFLLAYGVLDRDVDFDAWIDRRPLADAQRLLLGARAVA